MAKIIPFRPRKPFLSSSLLDDGQLVSFDNLTLKSVPEIETYLLLAADRESGQNRQ